MNLPDIAAKNHSVAKMLKGNNPHVSVAEAITNMGFPTTESSVRRYRARHIPKVVLNLDSLKYREPDNFAGMKILTLDIETSPNLGWVWGLWNQNIGLSQLEEKGQVISFAAKWHHKDNVMFFSDFHDGHTEMLEAAYALISEADVVVHFNGQSFDMKHLNREFLLATFTPPAPYQQVDLLKVVKKQFRFVSNKLDNVSQELGIGAKTSHTGFKLWLDCMANDPDAWELMRDYNMQDVVITEKLYDRLLPWIPSSPSHALYNGVETQCPNCGSEELIRQGYAYTNISKFQRYSCKACGKWMRGSKRLAKTSIQGIA